MRGELGRWNEGRGIELEHWVGCTGNFSLAVGYATSFWPEFVRFERYVLFRGFYEDGLRGFEGDPKATRQSIEMVMNHLHVLDIQSDGCQDASSDKLVFLGNFLRDMWEAKLNRDFPDLRFCVDFFRPEDPDLLEDYEVSFWQA